MPRPQPIMKPRAKTKPLHQHQSQLASPSQEALQHARTSLSQILPILQAVAHRHRNQHSSSHWWRSFGLLRRAARSFEAALLRRDNASPVVAHAEWMSKHVIPRAYIAFTQLAADNQHAPLGLMLLAALARVNSIVSNIIPSHHAASESDPPPAGPIDSSVATNPGLTPTNDDVDMGVAISRDDISVLKRKSEETNTSEALELPLRVPKKKRTVNTSKDMDEETLNKPPKDASKDRKKKKKKKGDDAMSSIFSGL